MSPFLFFTPTVQSRVSFNPWVYFSIFLAALSALSYFSLPLSFRQWIGLFGLVLPLTTGLITVLRERGEKGARRPLLWDQPSIPFWFWVLFLIVFSTVHFYKLATVPFWPLSDEGIFSSLALDLVQKWRWTLLWTQGRMEPLLLWLLSLFFRVVSPSLLSFRLFTTLFSVAGAIAAYFAARTFGPPLLSFVFCWLFSLSFWEIAMARQCTPNDLVPFFQLTAFAFLGAYWKAQGKTSSRLWIFILGLWCGLGFYTYTNWVVVWLFLGILVWMLGWNGNKLQAVLFTFLSAFLALPLVFARMAPGAMVHFQTNFAGFFSPRSWILYGRGLFWDGKASYPLGPIWGGYFNSVTGALILTGILCVLRHAELKKLVLGGIGIFLSLLPGLLTNNLELQRVTPCLVFFALLGAWGTEGLVMETATIHRKGLLLGLLMAPAFLNTYLFFRLYDDIHLSNPHQQWRNVEYYDAYRALQNLSREEGPLFVFYDFNTDYDNKTLNVACYPFDALHNPSLASDHPRWTALIVNVQYAPYLEKTFPGLRWRILRTDKTGPEDPKPFGIFLIPTVQISSLLLEHWKEADRSYRKIDFQIRNKKPTDLWAGFMESEFPSGCPFAGDRFLTAVYWEKLAFYKFLDGYFIQATGSYRNAVQRGVPAAHLYYDLGVCLKIQNRMEESQKCFRKAADLSVRVP